MIKKAISKLCFPFISNNRANTGIRNPPDMISIDVMASAAAIDVVGLLSATTAYPIICELITQPNKKNDNSNITSFKVTHIMGKNIISDRNAPMIIGNRRCLM